MIESGILFTICMQFCGHNAESVHQMGHVIVFVILGELDGKLSLFP